MTITILPARNEYTAIQDQVTFNYTFKIYTDTDLNVYVTPAGQEANDSTDIVTGYSVTGIGEEGGGSITLVTPVNANDLVTIVSNIPFNRTVDYQFNGDFVPDTVNNDIDRSVSLAKQVEDLSRRTFVFEQSLQGATNFTIGAPVPDYYLRWDDTGTKLIATLGTIDEDYFPILDGLVADANNSAQNAANCAQKSFEEADRAEDAADTIPDPSGGSDGEVITVDSGSYILAPVTAGGQVDSVVGTTDEIDVDNTDPVNPVVSISPNFIKSKIDTIWTGTAGDGETVDWSGSGKQLDDYDAILFHGNLGVAAKGAGECESTYPYSVLLTGNGRKQVGACTVSNTSFSRISVVSLTQTSLNVEISDSGAASSFIGVYGIKYS